MKLGKLFHPITVYPLQVISNVPKFSVNSYKLDMQHEVETFCNVSVDWPWTTRCISVFPVCPGRCGASFAQ